MRPKSTFYASENLRRLYRERVGDSMTQAQFAKRHEIGGQSMLAQILSGAKPLPIEAAPKLARALRCTIYDICPEMGIGRERRRQAILRLGLTVREAFNRSEDFEALLTAVYHGLKPKDDPPF